MLKLQLINLVWYISFCCAAQQQIGFYTQPDCKGDGLILASKQPDLSFLAPGIVSTSKSISTIGVWGLYQGINYNHDAWQGSIISGAEIMQCRNDTSRQYTKSVRYLGPPDTTTHSITLYETSVHRGRELIITGPASANIPIEPQSLITFGSTSWTLYSGTNFDGTAICFTPRNTGYFFNWIDSLNSTMRNVRSILRGCNRHIDYYISGGNGSEHFQIGHQ